MVYRLPSSIVYRPFPNFIACRGTFKKVITIHDLYFMEHPEVMSAEGAQYYRRIRESVQQADAIIAVSAFTRDDILRLLPEVPASKITVVHEAGDIRQDAAHLPQPRRWSTAFIALRVPGIRSACTVQCRNARCNLGWTCRCHA